jgi:hypothetical protein
MVNIGHHRETATGGWRRMHNEILNNLCLARYYKLRRRRMNWARHIGSKVKFVRSCLLTLSLNKKDHFENLGLGRRIILQ